MRWKQFAGLHKACERSFIYLLFDKNIKMNQGGAWHSNPDRNVNSVSQQWHSLKNYHLQTMDHLSSSPTSPSYSSPHPVNPQPLAILTPCLSFRPIFVSLSHRCELGYSSQYFLPASLSRLSNRGKQRQFPCLCLAPLQSTLSPLRTIFLQS